LQRWLQLLLYARPVGSNDIPNSLLPKAAARAALMEALCRERSGSRDEQDKAFLIGMFSLLDTLFGTPLEEILKPLKLGQDITDALLHQQGEFGALLKIAMHAEYGDTALLNEDDLAASGISVEVYCHSLVHAYRWASRVSSED
jgi:EAL and modified HD-GYP domain-containing signal transduction protein